MLLASRANAAPMLGLGLTSSWPAGQGTWYGNVVGSVTAWRGPVGAMVEGGVSPWSADRGVGSIGGALHVAPFHMHDDDVTTRGWLEVGASYEHWSSRDLAHPPWSRVLYRFGIGYDLVDDHRFGTQAFVRVQHGDALRATSNEPIEIAGTSVVFGFVVLRDI